jgi:hypothetical protein
LIVPVLAGGCRPTPALLTRTLSGPNFFSISSAVRCQPSRSMTSCLIECTRSLFVVNSASASTFCLSSM